MEQGHLKSRQIKAARALLDWSQDDLAHHSGLSVNTIRKLELGHISPRDATACSVRHAFEDNGLEFIEPDGVRHRPEDIRVYQGSGGIAAFFDGVYEFAHRKGGEIVVVCPSERPITAAFDDRRFAYYEKMIALGEKFTMKCILTEDSSELPASDYCEYRFMSKHYVNSVPFYVYDDKYAVFVFNADPSPKITVIQSRETADAFRLQFQSMWDKATPLNTTMQADNRRTQAGRRAS